MYKKIKRNYKVTSDDKLIIVDTSIGNVNLTFDKEKSYLNEVIIKKVSPDNNEVLVNIVNEIITLSKNGESVRIVSFGDELFPIKSGGAPKKIIDLKHSSDKIKLQNPTPFSLGDVSVFERLQISDGLNLKIKDSIPSVINDLYTSHDNYDSLSMPKSTPYPMGKATIGVAFWGMLFPDPIKVNGQFESDSHKDKIDIGNQFFKPRDSFLMDQAYADKSTIVKDNTSKAILYKLALDKFGPVNYLKEIDYSKLTIDETSGMDPTTVKVALLNQTKTKFFYKNAGVWTSLSTTSTLWASALVNNVSLQKLSDVRTPGYFNGLPEYLASIGFADFYIYLAISSTTAGTYPIDTAKPIIKSDRFLCMYDLTKVSELERLYIFDDSQSPSDIDKVTVKIIGNGVNMTNNAVVYRGGIWQNIQDGQPWMTMKEIKSIPSNAWKQLDSYLITTYNATKTGYNGGFSLIFKFPYINGFDTTATIGGLFTGRINDQFNLLDNSFKTIDGAIYEKDVTPGNYLLNISGDAEIIKEAIHIKTVEDFLNIGVLYPRNSYFILDNDLDFSELTDMPYVSLSGNFDGNNKVIKNLKVNSVTGGFSVNGSSLFSTYTDAPMKLVISNLTVEDWDINVDDYLYCFADYLYEGAVIENCHVKNSSLVSTVGDEASAITGGAASSSQILNCTVENTIIKSNGSGGYAAGIAVFIEDAIVKNCFVEGCTISGKSEVGGLFTELSDIPIGIENCMVIDTKVTGTVTGAITGGLAGYSYNVEKMYNCAFIGGSITGGNKVGGFIGQADSLYSVEDIVIATTIVGTGASEIITNSVYNLGNYGGYGVPSIYYDSNIAGTLQQKFTGITAATTAQMKSKAFWQDKLDPEVWDLVDGQYPKIKKDAKSFI